MFYNTDYVVTGPAVLVWDGITRPDKEDDGSLVHTVRVCLPDGDPSLLELRTIVQLALDTSEFRGVMPPGGNDPFSPADAAKLGAVVIGHTAFSAKTWRGVPAVLDANGQPVPPQVFASQLYPGCKIELLVHASAYNNKQKGVGFRLDGIRIIDATAPKLDVGGGLSPDQVVGAFGGQQAAATPPPPVQQVAAIPPPPPVQVQPAPDFLTMTPAAGNRTREQYHASGWTDEQLIANGLATR